MTALKVLTRDDILEADDRLTEWVDVPEWGGRVRIRALTAAGCSQVLRMVVTASGTTPAVGQVDIFNLAGGPSLIWVARAFGQEPPSGGPNPFPSQPPNAAPGGFILPWQGTTAASVARAPGNAADVDAFGHFLVVIWSYGSNGPGRDDMVPQVANTLVETALSQFADNRADGSFGR